MDAVLLAGGLGSRLSSVSGGLPKPLIEVGGRPFVAYVLDMLVAGGCNRIVVTASYRSDLLRDCLGLQYKGCTLDWSIESHALGTGGAIRQAFEIFGLTAAFVLNADTLFKIDLDSLQRTHVESGAAVTMGLREVPEVSRFGEVTLDESGSVSGLSEKGRSGPGIINGGVYLVSQDVWQGCRLPLAHSFERDFLPTLIAAGAVFGMVSSGYFIDIGVPEDLTRARIELRN